MADWQLINPLLAMSDMIWTGLIAALAAPAAALLVGRQLNNQRRAEKNEDYERQDQVAAKAETARVELAKNNQRVADEAARQQAQVAEVAAGAARLLVEAQATTKEDADEVARLAASGGGIKKMDGTSKLQTVVVSYPTGIQRMVELDGIPAKGEHILLRGDGFGDQPQSVVNVLWIEANGGHSPSVIVVIRPAPLNKQLRDATEVADLTDRK